MNRADQIRKLPESALANIAASLSDEALIDAFLSYQTGRFLAPEPPPAPKKAEKAARKAPPKKEKAPKPPAERPALCDEVIPVLNEAPEPLTKGQLLKIFAGRGPELDKALAFLRASKEIATSGNARGTRYSMPEAAAPAEGGAE